MNSSNKNTSLAKAFEAASNIDYQLKTAELAKEQLFLQKYTPLDNRMQNERDEMEE